VTCASDVLEALGGPHPAALPHPSGGHDDKPDESAKMLELEGDSAARAILSRLDPTPSSVDELVRQCHLSAPLVATILLELELAGRVTRHPGNQVSLLL
jgi:DNA processing protein